MSDMQRYPLAAWLLPAMLTAVISCAPDASVPSDVQIQAARGGGGGGKSSGPSVQATDPSAAPRASTLDVRVFGSGFDVGSSVSFGIKGVASSKLVVNSTSYVSETELVANLTIAADADTVKYDVIVLTSKGTKGIGSEMFAVTGDPVVDWLFPTDETGLTITSDGKFTDGGYSVYANGVCGVTAKIFASEEKSNSGDAIIQTNQTGSPKRAKCQLAPRTLNIRFPDGHVENTEFFANLHEIQNTGYSILEGETVERKINIRTYASGSRCERLRFREVANDGTYLGGDPVLVTRVNASTWAVRSKPYPNDKAYCDAEGRTYHMQLKFSIVLALP